MCMTYQAGLPSSFDLELVLEQGLEEELRLHLLQRRACQRHGSDAPQVLPVEAGYHERVLGLD